MYHDNIMWWIEEKRIHKTQICVYELYTKYVRYQLQGILLSFEYPIMSETDNASWNLKKYIQ